MISEAPLQGNSATYQVTIQNNRTTTSARLRSKYISCLREGFQVIAINISTVKMYMHKATSAKGANLSPIGQCDLTFTLGNKPFTDRFIALQDL